VDEKPVVLREDARPSLAADRPGRVLRRDHEYVPQGTVNVFCVFEPKAGRHHTKVTARRTGAAFAKRLAWMARVYSSANKIHLVTDNLNTHRKKSLTDFNGAKRGTALWKRFEPHYTPKHGCWLNQAEIEVSLLSRVCLGHDRVGDLTPLRRRAGAWDQLMNREHVKIDGGFTVTKAREKFGYQRRKGTVAFGLRRRRSKIDRPKPTLCAGQGTRLRWRTFQGPPPG